MSRIQIDAAPDSNSPRRTLINTRQGLFDNSQSLNLFDLETNHHGTAETHQIVMDLPCDQYRTVGVEIRKNRLIVMITAPDTVQNTDYEYYSEIELPPQTAMQRADVEIIDHMLIVTFDKTNAGLIQQAIASFPWKQHAPEL